MSSKECQINLIDVNFHHQKRLKFFEKNQVTISDPKKQEGKSIPPPLSHAY